MCTLVMDDLTRVLQEEVGLVGVKNVVPGRPPLLRGGGPPYMRRRVARGDLKRFIPGSERRQGLVPGLAVQVLPHQPSRLLVVIQVGSGASS